MTPELSIVIPVHNESPNIKPLYDELTQTLGQYGRSYELLIVDDGSTDDTFEQLAALQARDPRLRVIRFRRNFGQTAAFAAGFAYARGRLVVTSDGDLQNDPRDIPAMVALHRAGQRHRLRLAQGSQGHVRHAPRAVDDRQQADLVGDRRRRCTTTAAR